jgi:uncharacterized protein (TIGR00369 family)
VTASHHRKLENMYLGAPINQLYRPAIRIGDGTAEIVLPVSEAFFHAAGALHGSVYFKALDDACFFAAASLVQDVFALTTSFTTYFTRPVSSGVLTATGRVVHAGSNLLVAEGVAVGSDGREAARGSGTFMRSRVPLTPAIGYVEKPEP